MKSFAFLVAGALLLVSGGLQASDFGADRHVARGLNCQVCHGPDKANPQTPDENTCTTCHPRASVQGKTKKLDPNPHAAPHNGECTLCHLQHEPEENYCAQCHQFGFKMKH